MQILTITKSLIVRLSNLSTSAQTAVHNILHADEIRATKYAEAAKAALEQRRRKLYDQWLDEIKWLKRCTEPMSANPESATKVPMAAGHLERPAFLDALAMKPIPIHESRGAEMEAALAAVAASLKPTDAFVTYEEIRALASDAEAKLNLIGAHEQSRSGIEYLYEAGEHRLARMPGVVTMMVSIRRGEECWWLTAVSEGFNRAPACTAYGLRMKWMMESRDQSLVKVGERAREMQGEKDAKVSKGERPAVKSPATPAGTGLAPPTASLEDVSAEAAVPASQASAKEGKKGRGTKKVKGTPIRLRGIKGLSIEPADARKSRQVAAAGIGFRTSFAPVTPSQTPAQEAAAKRLLESSLAKWTKERAANDRIASSDSAMA